VPSAAAGTGLAVVVPRLLYAVSYSNGSTCLCSVLGPSLLLPFYWFEASGSVVREGICVVGIFDALALVSLSLDLGFCFEVLSQIPQ
jgi:hypothetical protein